MKFSELCLIFGLVLCLFHLVSNFRKYYGGESNAIDSDDDGESNTIDSDTDVQITTIKNNLEDEDIRWSTTIPVVYSLMNEDVKDVFAKAISRLENLTCLYFVPKRKYDDNNDILYIIDETEGCIASNLGKKKGSKNFINLAKECDDEGIIIQQIMYALGFIHEHQRPDRDEYIKIENENIDPSASYHFEISRKNIYNLSLPYDYYSITHFAETQYSKNGKPTITSKKKEDGVTFQEENHRRLSFLDIFKINLVYECFAKYPQNFNPQNWHFTQ